MTNGLSAVRNAMLYMLFSCAICQPPSSTMRRMQRPAPCMTSCGRVISSAAAALQAVVNVHQGGQFHVHAGKLHGQRIEPLFRASIGEMLRDAVFRADDELFGIGLFCISHNAGGRANIISLLHDLGAAFGMNQKQRLRVGSAGFGYICCRTYDMARGSRRGKRQTAFPAAALLHSRPNWDLG